ncbi:MAG: hypothetical protein PHI12_14675 [Dehalococcoidales bacterium]|nr:hypothetical protein [Dehalococcoidales bacterium]
MDYNSVDSFMKQYGLDREPAFDFLHFMDESIPPQGKKRILGLYYPLGDHASSGFGYLPPSTIVLPPDATVDTLLHELGHRHGDYYYDDISEEYAETWRKNFKLEPAMRAMPLFAARAVPLVENPSREQRTRDTRFGG